MAEKDKSVSVFSGKVSVVSNVRLSSQDLNEVYVESVLPKVKIKKQKKSKDSSSSVFCFSSLAKTK